MLASTSPLPAASPRALVVDDSPDTRMLLSALLLGQGFEVDEAADGPGAIENARTRRPDVILLDVGLPALDGIGVCRELRSFTDAYVLMLTGYDSEVDKVRGLGAGADDYITKPFSSAELLARVQAVQRRPRVAPEPAPDEALRRFGPLSVDPLGRQVLVDGRRLDLTRTEFDLLDALSSEPRVAFSRAQLIERVWGPNWYGDPHLVDVHVSNLRRKLGDTSHPRRFICTVRGVGYRMGTGD